MTPKDIHHLRENLTSIKAWIEHWKQDAECNLTCTQESLEMAAYRVKDSLRYLPEDATIKPELA